MDILIIWPFMLTGKWRSVNGVRFGDPSVLFGTPNYTDITIKTISSVRLPLPTNRLFYRIPRSLDALMMIRQDVTPNVPCIIR